MAYTTIDDPTIYFNTKLYTGNGSARTITGVGFQPDWVWVKDRSNANFHYVYDSVRGNNLNLFTNSSSEEVNVTTGQNGGGIGSQASDGFNIVAGNVNTDNVNTNSNNYVSWNWLATGSTASNSNGDITSTVSANTTAGFSIVSYTGTGANATVGHGLGAAPSWIIIKGRSFNEHWQVYHKSLGATKFTELSESSAASTNSNRFNDTDPTASVFTIGTKDAVSKSSGTLIAYCFAEKQGYSKFGSYTGNGNANGAFVYTGFCPAWVMIKRTDSSSDWNIMDNKRAVSFNPNTKELYSNSGQVEATGGQTIRDYLSNGFKLRGTSSGTNASGANYIYMAFSASSFVNSNGVPNNAE